MRVTLFYTRNWHPYILQNAISFSGMVLSAAINLGFSIYQQLDINSIHGDIDDIHDSIMNFATEGTNFK